MDLGVHETIYEDEEEEEEEEDENSSSSWSSSSSSPQSMIFGNGRSGRDPDVVIYVQGSSFRLHKEALTAKSGHLKRHLNELPEITLSPPLNITPQTFSLVTDFCYGTQIPITPFNVAALRTAAELLGMTEGEENLLQITEDYFRRVVAVDKECASIVLRSCFPLLPEAETAAYLVSRCVAALDGDYNGCLDEVKSVEIGVLKVILESLNRLLTEDRHDVLYKIIDIYLTENNGKVSENEKIKMCNYIDCSILSPTLLMHAVQNPKMPLRFVVQAMFLQQLNTRHSIISATDHHHPKEDDSATTLGAILERDAALRQVSHLKSIMTNTNSRLQTLEKELSGMRKLLSESEGIKNKTDSARSASFRFSSETNKIERGQTGSVSSLSYRDVARARGPPSPEGSSEGSPHVDKNLGRRLMKGLRNVFRLQKKKSESKGSMKNNEIFKGGDGNEDLIIIKKDQAFHKDP